MTTYVVTDYDGCDYITAGKRYEVIKKDGKGFRFRDDTGDNVFSFWVISSHIARGDWTVIEEPDTPKTWGEMTDAEKGALLLAHHEGKAIESMAAGGSGWHIAHMPVWVSYGRYRIKPEPVVGEVVLHTGQPDFYEWAACTDNDDTHTLTLPTLDGDLVTGEFANEDGMKVVIEEKK